MPDNKYIVFADVMGFAALVESEPDLELTPAMSRALAPDYNPNVQYANPADNVAPTTLVRTIGAFYRTVVGNEQYPRATSAVFFSDCVFLVFDDLDHAFFSAQGILNYLLIFHRIAVRVGIGFGTFIDARHSAIRTPRYSLTAAQFFGTGVTRAHAAERTKISGFRALIHPSVDVAASQNQFLKSHYVPLQSPSQSAAGEVNILSSGAIFSDANRMGSSLAAMKAWAPESAHHHYDATFIAVRNMYNVSPFKSGPFRPIAMTPTPILNIPDRSVFVSTMSRFQRAKVRVTFVLCNAVLFNDSAPSHLR